MDSDFGTAPDEPLADPGETQDTAGSDAGATTGSPEAPAEHEESFTDLDPRSLPPELLSRFKGFQGSYTKAMQALRAKEKELTEAHSLVQRFNTDPTFQQEIYRQLHQRYGSAGQAMQAPAHASPNGADEPPRELVDAMMAECPPELQWMVPSQAKMFWQANKQMLAPVLSQVQRQQQETLNERRSGVEAEMDEHYPIWRESDLELQELDRFLKSDDLRHPKYGSRLQLLYKALKGEALGTAAAARRMADAGRNRTVTGRAGSTPVANVAEQVLKAKNTNEAFALAAKAALDNPGG